MLEVVFSDSAAGTMAVAIGHKGFLGGATSVIISDGTVSKEEIEKFQHQAEERERSGWENAIPLEGNRIWTLRKQHGKSTLRRNTESIKIKSKILKHRICFLCAIRR